jgi:hypothetical protein
MQKEPLEEEKAHVMLTFTANALEMEHKVKVKNTF